MRYTLFTLLSILAFSACKNESTIIEPNIDYGYDYFPLSVGKEMIYRVDSIIFDPVTETEIVIDTNLVYVREAVVDTFIDEIGRTAFRIERSERPNVNVDWVLTDVWAATRTNGQAERFEENLRFIKMVFPARRGDLWNGNAFIDDAATFPIAGEQVEIFKGWAYEVLSTDELDHVGDFVFDEVITILQVDEENLIEKRFSTEKYARGLGLVYRKMEILDTQDTDNPGTWTEKAEKGFILEMTLVDYN